MEHLKKLFKSCSIGIGIGCTLITLAGAVFAPETRAIFFGTIILSMILALINTYIMGQENWSLLFRTVLTLGLGLVTFLVIAKVFNWFPFILGVIVTGILIYMAIFFIIWFVFYCVEKQKLMKFNQKQQK